MHTSRVIIPVQAEAAVPPGQRHPVRPIHSRAGPRPIVRLPQGQAVPTGRLRPVPTVLRVPAAPRAVTVARVPQGHRDRVTVPRDPATGLPDR
jgi:hypothetical protein